MTSELVKSVKSPNHIQKVDNLNYTKIKNSVHQMIVLFQTIKLGIGERGWKCRWSKTGCELLIVEVRGRVHAVHYFILSTSVYLTFFMIKKKNSGKTIIRVTSEITEWKMVYAAQRTDKGLVWRIYKELLKAQKSERQYTHKEHEKKVSGAQLIWEDGHRWAVRCQKSQWRKRAGRERKLSITYCSGNKSWSP